MTRPTLLRAAVLLLVPAALLGCGGRSDARPGAPVVDTLVVSQGSGASVSPSVPDTLALPFLSIPDLYERAPAPGRFNTRGYVIATSWCPPCPPNAACTPCVEVDSITLAVSPDVAKAGPGRAEVLPDQVWIRTEDPQAFRIGEAYVVSLEARVPPPVPPSFDTHDVVLLGATPRP